jgi:hypothetical protein
MDGDVTRWRSHSLHHITESLARCDVFSHTSMRSLKKDGLLVGGFVNVTLPVETTAHLVFLPKSWGRQRYSLDGFHRSALSPQPSMALSKIMAVANPTSCCWASMSSSSVFPSCWWKKNALMSMCCGCTMSSESRRVVYISRAEHKLQQNKMFYGLWETFEH